MSPRLIRLRAPDPLESALVAAADLGRDELEQLRTHVAALLEALPPPVSRPAAVVRARPAPPAGVPCGPRGGGFIQWKHVRDGAKVYGPSPYWRVRLDRRQRSIYPARAGSGHTGSAVDRLRCEQPQRAGRAVRLPAVVPEA